MATIKQVAERADVSTATVSRVLNGMPVRDDLRARVDAAISEMSYRPNRQARALRRQSATVWGLVVPDIRNPFFTALARAVEDVASRMEHSVLLCNSDESLGKEAQYLDILVAERVAGILLCPASEDETSIEAATAAGIPVVVLDRRLGGAPVDTVLVDNHRGARLAVEHLIANGARRPAILVGDLRVTTARERLAGYRASLDAAGIPFDPALVLQGDLKGTNAREITRELLARPDAPDALFVTNNLLTEGALEAVSDAGVDVPRQLKLASFDDIPLARLLRPSLTAVAQPTYDLGRTAAELLIQRMRGDTVRPREVLLAPSLEIRGTSGASDEPA
jgi:LacI family transcriptional regulator